MNFYRVVSPENYKFARFSRRGTWIPKKSKGPCSECGMTMQKRVPPLILEWEPDSDIIGDFSWGGFGSEIVVRRSVADELEREFSGFSIQPIKMIESTKIGRNKKPRVSLPYNGPELCELWIDNWASLDEKASEIVHEKTCSLCGFRFYKPKKIGLVLKQDTKPSDLFRVDQFPSWIFCLETVKSHVSNRKWSNISFE